MNIVKINDNDKTKYMELLLIADEQVSMIEKYENFYQLFFFNENHYL